jgi:hypothetical protein
MALRTSLRITTLLLLSGCVAPPPPPAPIAPSTVQIPSSPPTGAPLVDPAIVSVAAARVPAAPVIDGDLGEWGALPSPPPSLPPPVPYDEPEPKGKPVKVPNPSNATSHLAFALTPQVALIAAELDGPAREGIWLGIGSEPAELPLPGSYQGNAGYVPVGTAGASNGCAETQQADGEDGYRTVTRSPEAVAACQAELARHAERRAKHRKRFVRLYKIDHAGVHGVAEDGRLVALGSAKSAWKPRGNGATLEISLPLDTLPRMAKAPLASLRLVARAATSPEPPALDTWVWLELPDAVSFEPYGALRAHAFKRALDYGAAGPDGLGLTTYRLPRGMSYQAAEPSLLELVDSPDCMALRAREVPLYKKEASFGDVEVGYVAAPRGNSCAAEIEPWLAIFVKGKLVGIEPTGSPRGTITRAGELHVLSYQETRWSPVGGTWSVIALAKDGTRRAGVIEPVAGLKDAKGENPYWNDVSDFAGEDLDGFGWRGSTGKRGLEAIWRWDEARKVYRGTQRSIPPPKRRSTP